jgi:hypothetical protein
LFRFPFNSWQIGPLASGGKHGTEIPQICLRDFSCDWDGPRNHNLGGFPNTSQRLGRGSEGVLKAGGKQPPTSCRLAGVEFPPEFPSERSLATVPPTMKALMAALHSFQLASLQRRSGRYVEVGERAIIRSSTYILEGRARLNIFKDPPFSILKLCHFGRLVYFEIEIIQKRLDRHVTSNLI